MTRKSNSPYSDKTKAVVLTLLAWNGGNVKVTATQTGICRASLQNWRNGKKVSMSALEMAEEYKEDLADLLETKVYRLTHHMTEDKMVDASVGELMTAATKAIDKMLLLRGQPNRITENLSDEQYVDRVRELLERARARAIAAGAIDAQSGHGKLVSAEADAAPAVVSGFTP